MVVAAVVAPVLALVVLVGTWETGAARDEADWEELVRRLDGIADKEEMRREWLF